MKKDYIRNLLSLTALAGLLFFALGSGGGSSSSSSSSSSPPSNVPINSAWDGSVRQVERYLKDNLKDPDSYQGIEWSPVAKTDSGGYIVRHKYRAKNSFGGYVVEEKIFTMDSEGNVTGSTP